MTPAVYIGTSGWSYDEWKNRFYAGVRRADWLTFYAEHFNAVEVNATFYHTLKRPTLKRWRENTPKDFRFALKASRYLTHIERLDVTTRSFNLLRRQGDALGPKLAAVLWQLPQGLRQDLRLLERFVRRLDRWDTVHHAIEFRHDSWFDDGIARCLAEHRVAVVQSHAADWPLWNAVTTDLVYVRLHGGVRTYVSAYALATLKRWAARARAWVGEGRAVYVYFDNTAREHAVRNAATLVRMCEARAEARSAA